MVNRNSANRWIHLWCRDMLRAYGGEAASCRSRAQGSDACDHTRVDLAKGTRSKPEEGDLPFARFVDGLSQLRFAGVAVDDHIRRRKPVENVSGASREFGPCFRGNPIGRRLVASLEGRSDLNFRSLANPSQIGFQLRRFFWMNVAQLDSICVAPLVRIVPQAAEFNVIDTLGIGRSRRGDSLKREGCEDQRFPAVAPSGQEKQGFLFRLSTGKPRRTKLAVDIGIERSSYNTAKPTGGQPRVTIYPLEPSQNRRSVSSLLVLFVANFVRRERPSRKKREDSPARGRARPRVVTRTTVTAKLLRRADSLVIG